MIRLNDIVLLTTKRYQYTTVYVDQSSMLSYVNPKETASVEDTLEEKEAWEMYDRDKGVTIKSYHGNNGIFKAKKWVESCHRGVQGIDFAGLNAHNNNGMAEIRIRELKEPTCIMLIHFNRKLLKAVAENLWPYALHMANNVVNETLIFQNPDKKIPRAAFSVSQVDSTSKHWEILEFQVYVLDIALQATQPRHTWSE